jgi:hypothetical protein
MLEIDRELDQASDYHEEDFVTPYGTPRRTRSTRREERQFHDEPQW